MAVDYTIKSNGKDKHFFDKDVCMCDGRRHDDWKFVRVGLAIRDVTCRKCIESGSRLFMKIFNGIMASKTLEK